MSGHPPPEFTELVAAKPFRLLLERLIERSRFTQIVPAHGWVRAPHSRVQGGRVEAARVYAERFGTTDRTADRHFAIVLHRDRIPLFIADRIAALADVPFAYLIATSMPA